MQSRTSPAAGRGRQYCSEANPAESLWGTAATVDVWICLEYRPAWKARVLEDNALSAPVRNWLEDNLAALEKRGLKGRPQFIRQPEVATDAVSLLLAANGQCVEFRGQGYDFLLDLNLADVAAAPASHGRPLDAPVYLVCTNGQRDLCCARFGLPTYNALKERVGRRVWQVTHLGGHRFAPNVLVLPEACLYGRVDGDSLDEFLDASERGRLDFHRLRGRTCYQPLAQAAEAALGLNGVRLLHVDGDDAEATVTFADAAARHTVTVRRSESSEQVIKSCGDEASAEVFPYVAA